MILMFLVSFEQFDSTYASMPSIEIFALQIAKCITVDWSAYRSMIIILILCAAKL